MSAFISKYGVAVHVRIPMVKRGVVDHAVGADWTPAAGDVKISKDGGASANVTNLPTAIAMGNSAEWDFSLTATEMQAAQVNVTIADSATKAVEDSGFVIWTHGNASAQYQVDLSDSTAFGLSRLDATISSRSTYAGGAVASVTAGVTVTTNNDKTGYALSNAGVDAVLDRTDGIETGWTLRQALRLVLAALAGKLSGAATTTVTIRDVNDTKNRIVATVDASGNRTAVTKDVT
jgi:hypothetical protein